MTTLIVVALIVAIVVGVLAIAALAIVIWMLLVPDEAERRAERIRAGAGNDPGMVPLPPNDRTRGK